MTLEDEMQAGAQAQRFAETHRHLLADHCGVVLSREETLVKRIADRQRMLLQNAMPRELRRSLTDANELDAQELAILEGERQADGTASELGRWLIGGVVGCAIVMMAAHFVASNWGL